ncbi:MAG: Ppx/GppA family phosphatase [Defluviitaleaceae bacterium]|nr:Ppx/GppA family phosphatase [Defluviitaleaceae bacterium]
MSRKAIIDVGSNSIKFFLGEVGQDGTVQAVIDENDIVRLGEGLRETGVISTEAMRRNSEAISRFAEKARANGADEIVCVGTMALRNAKNTDEFVKLVKETSGIQLSVIPGGEEARLAYLAVLSGLPLQDGKLAIFDTGGGSTEFVFGECKAVSKRFSVDLGAIRITEKYFKADPVSKSDVSAAIQEIDSVFAENDVCGNVSQLVGMGGTVTSMGAVKHKMAKYDPDVIQGSTLTLTDVEEQIEAYSSRTIEERKDIVGLQPKRADVILAGACILKVIISRLGVDKLTISDRGLRHGMAFDMFAKK